MPLTSSTVYCVYKENGKCYNVYSKEVLDRRIEDGRITDACRVVIQRVNN